MQIQSAKNIDKRSHFHGRIIAGNRFIGKSIKDLYFLSALFRRIIGKSNRFTVFQFAPEDAPSDPFDCFAHPADGFVTVGIFGDGVDGFFVIALHHIRYRFVADFCTKSQKAIAIGDFRFVVFRKIDTVGCTGLHFRDIAQVGSEST